MQIIYDHCLTKVKSTNLTPNYELIFQGLVAAWKNSRTVLKKKKKIKTFARL
jgi:hypothetical protein